MEGESASSSNATGNANVNADQNAMNQNVQQAAQAVQNAMDQNTQQAVQATETTYAAADTQQPYTDEGMTLTPRRGDQAQRDQQPAARDDQQQPSWQPRMLPKGNKRSLSVPVPGSPESQREVGRPQRLGPGMRLPLDKGTPPTGDASGTPPTGAAPKPPPAPGLPEAHHIGSRPGSELGQQVRDDDAGMGVTEKLFDKMSEVIVAMNAQVAALTKRMEDMDRERAKRDDPDKLAKINHKDISKPGKFAGGNGWTTWSKNFSGFLERRDVRWPKLLEAIAKRSAGPPLNEDIKVAISRETGILDKGDLEAEFEKQLYDYLQEFTSGDVLAAVIAGGKQGSWETWRYLCEQGKSRQKHSLKEEHRRLVHPKQADVENLMKAIHSWEADLAEHLQSGGRALDEEERIMCLEEMCPAPLQEHLSEKAEEKCITTYTQYKNAISAYVTRKLKTAKATRPGARALAPDSEEYPSEEPGEEVQAQNWNELQRLCSMCGLGDLNALVNNKFGGGKKGKGKGKSNSGGKSGDGKGHQAAVPMDADHSGKDCYECGEVGHIGANCPVRQARLAAQASQPGARPGFDKGSKGKGNKGGGKGGYKGGKGGWPSLPTWNQMYPGPTQQQWKTWWQQAQSTGTVNLLEGAQPPAATQPAADWSAAAVPPAGPQGQAPTQTQSVSRALFSQGSMYSLKPKTYAHVNKFEVLTSDENEAREDPDASVTVPPTATKLRDSKISLKKTLCRGSESSHAPTCESACCRREKAMEVDLESAIKPPSLNRLKRWRRRGDAANEPANLMNDMLKAVRANAPIADGVMPKQHLKIFTERSREALCQVKTAQAPTGSKSGKWEVLSAIVDSGASITAVSPKTGKAYKVQEGEACKKGIEYATAGGDTLPNLGEKHMAVLTKEGTVRGFSSQVADVSEPLESVRQLLGAKHCVLFGLGPNESEHLIINKVTGEVNVMRDDGTNYLHDMIIIPPDEVEQVQKATQSPVFFGGQA